MLDQDNIGGQGALNSSSAMPDAIAEDELGHAILTPTGDFEAGSWQTFKLVYTCGKYGMDDSASMRICFRFASDQSRPQFDDPKWRNWTRVEASNNAVLETRYDPKGNVRPWDRALYIKVVKGFMQEGDTITITFGDTSEGSQGMRLQTFCEDSLEFRVLVDPIATANYQALPVQPTIRIVPGKPAIYAAVVPTERKPGGTFELKIKGEDIWGNPSDQCDVTFQVKSSRPVNGLPGTVTLAPGEFACIVDGLSVDGDGPVDIWFEDAGGNEIFRANPLVISAGLSLLPYWVDLHGQSEETIGTGTAREFFEFARDKAFVDAAGHQGNDFQITKGFWSHLDDLCEEFDEPGRFLTPLGYEWSGNTALGGDRNVFYPDKNRTIRRSSHALVDDKSDLATDCNTAGELFQALTCDEEWDVVSYAHCGGRYADVKLAHDGRIEKSMEIHSSWGSFEWLAEDALDMGYRTGIVANSDGHKGRPGASYPGASLFGAVGGLTCMLMPDLTRDSLFDCIRKRRHYATTGGHGGRMVISANARFDAPGTLYHDDPALDYPTPPTGTETRAAMMGDIVHLPEGGVDLDVDITAASPIERVDIFNGRDLIETIRPYTKDDLGGRIRVHWEGAEYRGRFRQVIWDGTAHVQDNEITRAQAFNFFNPEKVLDQPDATSLKWMSLTTGNFAGFDMWVKDAWGGTLKIETPLVQCGVPLEDIGLEDEVFDKSGILPRFLKIFRLPEENPHRSMKFTRKIDLRDDKDNAIFVRLTQEDGTRAWTSPIYVCQNI
ncbi:MAG: DUF3604 domain-containing protein [Proteobacteria bacterium]|nr:DUF3604 domain-containing protein [Pseudomonadota bacterium]MDA1023998.1 DUF3604 domain-containing protein [Pseudomonadota bacterium]